MTDEQKKALEGMDDEQLEFLAVQNKACREELDRRQQTKTDGKMPRIVDISPYGTLPVITFYNKALQAHYSLVFQTAEAARGREAELRKLPHIEMVCIVDATVVDE